ncbi:GPR1/FUN34/yaaH family-domain-containing protein [Mrakia frigida]|uniref:acetate uptake transporter family protein n=1 Tax=Mrakia frigida TaxID=29902 RepID=UPI003FCC1CD2
MSDLEQGTHSYSTPSMDHKRDHSVTPPSKDNTQHFEVAPLARALTPGGHPLDTSQPSFPVYHRKFGNPSPLGLFAFAFTTFVLSWYNAGIRGIKTPNVVVSMCFGMGGAAQFLSGQWEFAVGNTFGATAFSAYGTFWISFGLIYWPSSGILTADWAEGELESALGIYILTWFILTFIMLLGTLKTTLELFLTFFFLDLTFLLLACAQFMQSAQLTRAGGAVGILTSFIAIYTGFEGIYTAETSYFLLPSYDLNRLYKGNKAQ